MNYSNELKVAVRHLTQNYVLPQLHPAMVAQWILESERGFSKLAREFRNFAGMKWRKELTGIGESRLIDVPSEPTPTDFTWFASPQKFVQGFYRFLDREPYDGWRNSQTAKDYIEHIGNTWATDPRYVEKVKALIPEAEKLISAMKKENDMPDPQWFELYKNMLGGSFLVAYSGSEALFRTPLRTTADFNNIYSLFGEHNLEVAPEGKLMPVTDQKTLIELEADKNPIAPPKPPVNDGELKGLRVFLEAGHGWSGSSFDPGAVGHVQEWTQNKIQATACAKWLRARGAEVRLELYERGTPARDLRTRGRIAGGSDVFVSFHHNAFNGKAQGTETCIDRLADKDDRALAEIIQSHMMKVSPFTNRGIKQQGLGVLRGAKPGCFAACLTEAYFVDGPRIQNPDELDKKLGIAVAQGIVEFAQASGKIGK